MPENPFFIIAGDLAQKLENTDLRVVDASWYLPAMGRNGRKEFEVARIPGAVFFDIDAVCDTDSDLPHMLARPEEFAKAIGQMGISQTDEIIIYDGPGVFSSARVWWNFRVMGAKNVKILTGGIDGWKAKGLPLETGAPQDKKAVKFTPKFQAEAVRDYKAMRDNLKNGDIIVLDARPLKRFTGEEAEPRPGLAAGHMPGSRSLPAAELIANGALLPINTLKQRFDALGIKPDSHVTTSCGSGVTAAILSMALESIGHKHHSLYDGSWAEWGARSDAPVTKWED